LGNFPNKQFLKIDRQGYFTKKQGVYHLALLARIVMVVFPHVITRKPTEGFN
jgi:hypothetical protein